VPGIELDHLGIAVENLEAACHLYRELGMVVSGVEEIAHEQVRVAMLPAGDTRLELLESTGEASAIARFIARRGPGLHHIALRVPALKAAIERLKSNGVRLISEQVKTGAGGHRYVFLHPSTTSGVLIELVEQSDT
jgi:LAO/AO transport system kinase